MDDYRGCPVFPAAGKNTAHQAPLARFIHYTVAHIALPPPTLFSKIAQKSLLVKKGGHGEASPLPLWHPFFSPVGTDIASPIPLFQGNCIVFAPKRFDIVITTNFLEKILWNPTIEASASI